MIFQQIQLKITHIFRGRGLECFVVVQQMRFKASHMKRVGIDRRLRLIADLQVLRQSFDGSREGALLIGRHDQPQAENGEQKVNFYSHNAWKFKKRKSLQPDTSEQPLQRTNPCHRRLRVHRLCTPVMGVSLWG